MYLQYNELLASHILEVEVAEVVLTQSEYMPA